MHAVRCCALLYLLRCPVHVLHVHCPNHRIPSGHADQCNAPHKPATFVLLCCIQRAPSNRLNIKFTERYPLEPPEVTFLTPTPVHPHIYSNGHICLDILYDGQNGGWSPALTINKLCLSLRSMLASNTDKVRACVHEFFLLSLRVIFSSACRGSVGSFLPACVRRLQTPLVYESAGCAVPGRRACC
jgi:hypothetical protein